LSWPWLLARSPDLAQLAQFRFGLAGRFAAWALIDQGVGC
jgi:hypothetical protein